ncbi:hypothetical protein [Trinickia fusca]|uniref:Uncharacterized protein n=1 Tax=Trinickia fusca TaxID=2419777 RepID=A0A494XFE6_9BURK|nr:hypothetical protein [Trinickia fusca]RKP46869.1 hypothetical protein D7S89_16055 [Trinickia fusca]
MDMLDKMVSWEDGTLAPSAVIEMMQELIDSGEIEHQSDTYQFMARALVDAALCRPRLVH